MRYIVETDDELVLKNIKLNNKCVISPEGDACFEEAPFVVYESESGFGKEYECPICGRRMVVSVESRVNYCAWCGTKNGGAE